MPVRTQQTILWWGIGFLTLFGVSIIALFHMVPPPAPSWTPDQIAAFYQDNQGSIKVGAVITSWTAAYMVPLAVVIYLQIRRLETVHHIWSLMALIGGVMMSIFFALPVLFWGVAAYTPTRAPEITAVIHELGMLTFFSTSQYFVFMWVAITIICFKTTSVRHSPFPRWFGYLTGWTVLIFEAGALAFIPRAGAFAWDGLFIFWIPMPLFGVWLSCFLMLMINALKKQRAEEREQEDALDVSDDAPPALATS